MKIALLAFLIISLSAFSHNIKKNRKPSSKIPEIYLFLGGDSVANNLHLLEIPNVSGVQIIYTWKKLEKIKDQYDFSSIQQDLEILESKGKKLFIQIQDRSFLPHIVNVPKYLQTQKEFEGGIEKQGDFPGEGLPPSYGWVAKQWIPAVNTRYKKLIEKLGEKFDAKIAGINLPESAVHLDPKNIPADFNCDNYFSSVLENMKILKKSFVHSYVVQYVNFYPCEWNNDKKYMSRTFELAKKLNIGLGNPDTVPYRKGQMANSYPFFNKYNDQIQTTAIAVQEPDYTYTNPQTKKPFTVKELYDFSINYLGSDIIFWNKKEPQFTNQVIPLLKNL